MSIDIENINKIMNSINNELKIFLTNDMSLNILKIKNIPEYIPKEHFATIKLSRDISLVISLNIDNSLFEVLFNNFFEGHILEDDKEELIAALPDEIINIVVGLAIKGFPKKYRDLELGLPLKLQQNQILEILNKNTSLSYKIVTNSGNLVYSIIYKV